MVCTVAAIKNNVLRCLAGVQIYLWQKGIEPQNQLDMATEQHLDLVYDTFSVDPADKHSSSC